MNNEQDEESTPDQSKRRQPCFCPVTGNREHCEELRGENSYYDFRFTEFISAEKKEFRP